VTTLTFRGQSGMCVGHNASYLAVNSVPLPDALRVHTYVHLLPCYC
jgi:hypothetical protein